MPPFLNLRREIGWRTELYLKYGVLFLTKFSLSYFLERQFKIVFPALAQDGQNCGLYMRTHGDTRGVTEALESFPLFRHKNIRASAEQILGLGA
jgi:hypothetical protein